MARAAKPKKIAGQRDEIEEFLNSKSVKWTLATNVPITEFDLEKSLRNQARINIVLNEAQVETYVDAMKRGDDFPAVICYKDGPKYVAVDGNHRLQAAKIVGVPISVYVLDPKTDRQVVVHLTFEANTRHGLPNSIDERIRHGIYMLANGATSQEAVAQRINVPLASLKRAWTKKIADDRAEEVGLLRRDWEALNVSSRMRLRAVHTDEGFTALADLVIKAQLDSTEVDAAVSKVNKVRSSAGQRQIVADLESIYRARIQATGAGLKSKKPRVQSPRTAILSGIGQINWAFDRKDSILDQVAPAESGDFIKALVQAAENILVMVEALQERDKPSKK